MSELAEEAKESRKKEVLIGGRIAYLQQGNGIVGFKDMVHFTEKDYGRE